MTDRRYQHWLLRFSLPLLPSTPLKSFSPKIFFLLLSSFLIAHSISRKGEGENGAEILDSKRGLRVSGEEKLFWGKGRDYLSFSWLMKTF